MIRLGHIEYSNCIPVHAALLDAAPAGVEIVHGVPSRLNADLAAGRVDVAPCSSIEYARNAERYRLLPGLAIASEGAVGSILFESTHPLAALDGREVAVPTASATSVVLLRILLERRYGVTPRLRWYTQEAGADPVAAGAAAALWIGDPALRRVFPAGRPVHDLGTLWTDWTGLPFVFALWQTSVPRARDAELAALQAALFASRRQFEQHAASYAARYAGGFGLAADRLLAYWRSLRYTLDAPAVAGLMRFYAEAALLGEAPPIDRLVWVGGNDGAPPAGAGAAAPPYARDAPGA
jgi:chorismate dehydratase